MTADVIPITSIPRTRDDDIVADMLKRAFLLDAFLKRPGLRSFRTLNTVSVSFASELEAQEFHKLVKRGARK